MLKGLTPHRGGVSGGTAWAESAGLQGTRSGVIREYRRWLEC